MYNKGDRIWLDDEKKPYKIRACDKRYLICTKPFNPQHTVLYTIIDLEEEVRSTENLVFCMGFETDEDCEEALQRLNDTVNPSELSRRHKVALRIVRVDPIISKDKMHSIITSQLELVDALDALRDLHEAKIASLQTDNNSLTEALRVALKVVTDMQKDGQ